MMADLDSQNMLQCIVDYLIDLYVLLIEKYTMRQCYPKIERTLICSGYGYG